MMVTPAVPVLVSVTVCVPLLPTVTFPKLTEPGDADNWRLSPMPASVTEVGDFLASLVTEMLPDVLPTVLGSKTALKDVLEPGSRVMGNCRPLTLKADPVTLALVIVTAAVPVSVNTTACVLVVPKGMLPNPTLGGDAVS